MNQQKTQISCTVLICAVAFGTLSASGALGQAGVYAYPLKGQSPQQQQRDQAECHQWAVQQTGFDPSRAAPPPPPAYVSPPPSYSSSGRGFGSGEVGQGGVLGDGARGAALGAIGGAIAGDAGKGAAIGAASGALFGGVQRSNRRYEEQRWQQQQQQQAMQQQQMAMQQYEARRGEYSRAYAVCMSARKYRVQ